MRIIISDRQGAMSETPMRGALRAEASRAQSFPETMAVAAGNINPATAAHIHRVAAGEARPPVVQLEAATHGDSPIVA